MLLRSGIAAKMKMSRGLTYISTVLLFDAQQWLNSAPLLQLASFFCLFDEKLREGAAISSVEVGAQWNAECLAPLM